MKKILTIITGAFLLITACSEKSQPDQMEHGIAFSLGKKQLTTKVGTTMSTLEAGTDKIYVYGYKDASAITISNNLLKYDSDTKYWTPTKWNASNNNQVQWESGKSYEFYANAYNQTSTSLLNVSSATSITINQPESYNESQMVDYLLSYRFTCNGTAKPLVQLELEHAVAKVDILVIREKTVKNAVVTELTCSNFYRQATMQCHTHQVYDENDQLYNVWKTTLAGAGTTEYTRTSTFNTTNNTGGLEAYPVDDTHSKYDTPAQLSFLAVPQPLTKEQTRISLKYYTNESSNSTANYVLHDEDSFDLVADGLPTEWESGHRYVYIIKINTGVDLTAQVLDWVAVDYIEGTVLPDVDEDKQ